MRIGIHGHRPGAHLLDQPVEALVQQAGGALERRQVPHRVLEQVGPGVLHAARLRSGDRVTAHEAGVVDLGQQRGLGGAHVGDHAVLGRRLERGAHLAGQGAHRRTGEAGLGAVESLLERPRGHVDGPQLASQGQPIGAASESHHLGAGHVPAGREADRAADQPDAEDGDPHPERRARTAPASPSSTSEVMSQSMHASVMDCP